MPFDAAGFVDPQLGIDLEVLRKARALLALRGGWCRGEFHIVHYKTRWFRSRDSYCAVGALREASSFTRANNIILRHLHPLLWPVFQYHPEIHKRTPQSFLTWFNDLANKRTVLQLFDWAIQDLERKCAER